MPEKRAKMDNKMDMRAVACVLLAAGAGSRFGGGKLLAEFGGDRLFERAMNVLPKELFSRESERRGFLAVRNSAPEKGVSLSIRLGLEAVKPCSAVLFLVCDQPLLRKESVLRILEAGAAHPEKIVVPEGADGRLGNPCLFPAAYFPELAALEGDRGGKRVIRAHPEAVLTVPLPEKELFDTDTKEDLSRLKEI